MRVKETKGDGEEDRQPEERLGEIAVVTDKITSVVREGCLFPLRSRDSASTLDS